MTHLAFATMLNLAHDTGDETLLADAFAKRGIQASLAAWDNPEVDWRIFDMVLIRSTWNYYQQHEAFSAWLDKLEQLGVPLYNPAAMVRGNMHKSYLLDLAAAGANVVETRLFPKGSQLDLAEVLAQTGWDEAVVKPAISATAYNTRRFTARETQHQQAFVSELLRDNDVLLQPFMTEVVDAGELSLLYFGGRFSHAVVKQARAGDFRVQENFGGSVTPFNPSPEILAQADAIVAAIVGDSLYARVDVILSQSQLLLMELELIEPQLFISQFPESADRLVDAMLARI